MGFVEVPTHNGSWNGYIQSVAKEGFQDHGNLSLKFPTMGVRLGTASVGHKVEVMFGCSYKNNEYLFVCILHL